VGDGCRRTVAIGVWDAVCGASFDVGGAGILKGDSGLELMELDLMLSEYGDCEDAENAVVYSH
jgi:hypothetical protein